MTKNELIDQIRAIQTLKKDIFKSVPSYKELERCTKAQLKQIYFISKNIK